MDLRGEIIDAQKGLDGREDCCEESLFDNVLDCFTKDVDHHLKLNESQSRVAVCLLG